MAVAGFYVFNEAVANDAAERVGQATVVVPDVQGNHKDTARRIIGEAGLTYGESNPMPSAKIERDYVMLQRPAPGTVVRAGRRVFVTLSEGQESVVVPKIIGMKEDEARNAIAKANLTVGPSVAHLRLSAPAGTVVGQYPVAGQTANRNSPVYLLVSEGQGAASRVLVPNLVNLDSKDAASILERVGLTMKVVPDTTADAKIGTVVKQDPQNGQELAAGGTVVLSVRIDAEAYKPHEAELKYKLPQGFGERDVEIWVIDEVGTRQVGFRQKLPAGTSLTLPLKFPSSVTAEVYVDGALVRRYVYDGDNPPVITDL